MSICVPLLNQYKYGLCRRRFLQTLFGGPVVRRAPWFVHVIQTVLWLLPLILSIPFIVLDGLMLWNQYFLALVYGCVMGTTVLLEGVLVFIIRRNLGLETRVQFDDEDESVNIWSFNSTEMIDFMFSFKSKFSIFLHPFVSGLFSFAGCFLLLPTILQETLSISLTVVVSVIGWLTLCSAHYSLSTRVPLETAVYRPTDLLQLRFYYRPFYILILGSIFIPIRLLVASPHLYLGLLYGALCLFPLGWVAGVLPPLDALLPWFMELVLTRFLGSSPMATDLRLGLAFISTVVAVTIGATIRNGSVSLLLLTAFGYLLSQDPYVHCKAFLCLISSKLRNRIGRYVQSKTCQVISKTLLSYGGIGDVHLLPNSTLSYLLILSLSILRGCMMLSVSLLSVYFISTAVTDNNRELLTKVLSGVVIGTGCFVFASDLIQASYIFGIIRNPFLPTFTGDIAKYRTRKGRIDFISLPRKIIIIYVIPLLALTFVGLAMGPIPSNFFQRIAVARILRKVWQNTLSALTELVVVSVILLAIPTINSQSSIGFPLLTLLVGLSVDVTFDFVRKAGYVGKLFITFLWLRKQRTYIYINIFIGVCTFLFFPFLVAIIITSSILSAPLLPLFTLPIFFVAFPRAQHFWPSLVDFGRAYLNTDDTIYYQQAEQELAKAMYRCVARGSVSSQPGTMVLFRFDNRLALITILETEYGSCVINLKGLELQETSCHSEEATMVDDMFESLHDQNSRGISLLNKNIFSTLLPSDTMVIQTYSDARNVLTGIIDQPEALHRFSSNLIKTLIWVFYSYFIKTGMKGFTFEAVVMPPVGVEFIENLTTPVEFIESLTTSVEVESEKDEAELLMADLQIVPTQIKGVSTESSEAAAYRSQTNFALDSTATINDADVWQPPELIPADEPVGNNCVIDRSKTSWILTCSSVHPVDDSTSPKDWAMVPLTYLEMHKLMNSFPEDWYSHLTENKRNLDSKEYEWLRKVVVGSFGILDVPSRPAKFKSYQLSKTTPLDITRGFHGKFPDSSHMRWMSNDHTLMSLALKAYRYAVKLMYDEGSLGEVESLTELSTYLEEYENEWCIASENEKDWKSAILSKCPHLFSVDHDPETKTYTARVLSLQDEVVHVGSLNRPALEGMWANMSFELLYLTNDDEERYSIQAHPYLLRNISSQLSEPPLGYCIYSSGLITIPST